MRLRSFFRAAGWSFFAMLALAFPVRGGEDEKKATEPPITTVGGALGDSLRTWYADGTAAGLKTVWYDNRDRGHSHANLKHFPQVQKVKYAEEELKKRADWAAARMVRPFVTVGNSSTSAPPNRGGSNPRQYYVSTPGLMLLFAQYVKNNLYVYPEHRDHDVGFNGRGDGYGDLFPTNTPFLIISQGSSGSDRAFLHAVFHTISAFHPDVQAFLIQTGTLMPTVQAIFRKCNAMVETPADYLTGKAHPTVFRGDRLRVDKMVNMAHEMTRATIPPVVQMHVKEEPKSRPGVDVLFTGQGETLVTTPFVIARLFRGVRPQYRMVVDVAASKDPNNRPLTFQWVVLRGDADAVSIQPKNDSGSQVEIRVPWPERIAVPGQPALQSNRIDIGVFATNGDVVSVPGFVTFYGFNDEVRTVDGQGRVREIAYGVGDPSLGYPGATPGIADAKYDITHFPRLIEALAASTPAGALLRTGLAPAQVKALQAGLPEMEAAAEKTTTLEKEKKEKEAAFKEAREAVKKLEKAAKKDETSDALKTAKAEEKKAKQAMDAARKAAQTSNDKAAKLLRETKDALGGSVQTVLEAHLNALAATPDFYIRHQNAIEPLIKARGGKAGGFVKRRDQLKSEGILAVDGKGAWSLASAVPGDEPALARLTRYEKNRLAWLHLALFEHVLCPGLVRKSWKRNYVDPRLSLPKTWRDLYAYDDSGNLTGWVRLRADGDKQAFTAHGHRVMATDGQGRATKARAVKYDVTWKKMGKNGRWPDGLKQVDAPAVYAYTYAGPDDRVGTPRKASLAGEHAKGAAQDKPAETK